MENHMCKKPQRFLIAAVATVGFGFANLLAGTIHQEYDGPWHWDELTRQTKSLDGKSAPVDGVWYPILEGTEYTGTAEITGSRVESGHLSIPSRISYRHWVKGPWGENGVETLLSYQTNDFEVVSITAGNVAPGFQLKSWLKDISIPSSVTNIGHGAFYGCANLTNVSLSARIDRIQDSTFLGTGLKTIMIPDSVTAIDYAAFNTCSNLCEVIAPASVKEIGEFAFGACYSLTNVVLMGATNINRGAFWKCFDLKNVSLSGTLKSIDDHAFGACTALESIAIPDSVEYVHDNAFLGCTNLDRIIIGKSVNSYGFIGCGKILEIHSPFVVEMVSASESVFEGVTNIVLGAEIKNVTESFYSHFPSYNRGGETGQISEPDFPWIVLDGSLVSVQGTGLTTFDVPVTVTQIAETAFEDCPELREIIIPDSVTRIEANAFQNCTNLERIVIGAGVINVDVPLFSWRDEAGLHYGSQSLKELVVASPQFYESMFMDDNWNWTAEFPAVTNVVFAGDGFETIGNMGAFPALEAVTLPDTLERVNERAFRGCRSLRELTIPESVTYIGQDAFHDCTNLERLVVLCEEPTNIGAPLFSWWDEIDQTNRLGSASLKELVVASPWFYESMFMDDYWNWTAEFPAVTNVVFGEAFTSVGGMGAFPALEAVTLPDGAYAIEPYAFQGCANLKELVVPDSVEYVGEGAFMDCLSLERLVVGSGVESAGAPLFSWWDEIDQTNRLGSASLKELVVASPWFYESMFMDDNWNWTAEFPAVTNVVFGWRFGDVPENCAYAFPSLISVNVAEAFPQTDSHAELMQILKDSHDGGLTNIVSVAAYNSFVTWAESVGTYEQSRNQTMQMVKSSPNAWLSYALGASSLIEGELKSDDITISSFEPAGENGVFSFEVAIDGVNIGGGSVAVETLKENLKKVLGVEGAKSLSSGAFSSDNIDITFDTPVDGKARFTVTPPADVGNSFFLRVKMK